MSIEGEADCDDSLLLSATPCGAGGYAIHDYIITSWCRGPLWFVCAVFQRGKDKTERICYGLDWRDDGE